MKAIILAAGKGKRLGSFTDKTPKGLVKINGKTVLEYIINDLVSENFDEICIVVGYHADQIMNYFATGKNFGAKICYTSQPEQLGTADALKQAEFFVQDCPFLLHLGDAINPKALQENIQNMMNDECSISLLVCATSDARKKHVGNIEMINNRIVKISEKSSNPTANFFWAGTALFKNGLIFQKLENLKISHTGEYEITDVINNLILEGIKVSGFICKLSIDTGTYEGIDEASKNLK